MQAKDIMTHDVETVSPDTAVSEIAQRLIARNISAMPVVDEKGAVVGIVSEGDLMRRAESGTERRPSWWIRLFAEPEDRAREYIKSHGKSARDIMTRKVISVREDTPLANIAETLERHHIKRVTVMRDGQLVGIVSRANLLRGLVAAGAKAAVSASDRDIKSAVEKAMAEADLGAEQVSVVVADGVVTLWGMVGTTAERSAVGMVAEQTAGVARVDNNVNVMPAMVRTSMGAQ